MLLNSQVPEQESMWKIDARVTKTWPGVIYSIGMVRLSKYECSRYVPATLWRDEAISIWKGRARSLIQEHFLEQLGSWLWPPEVPAAQTMAMVQAGHCAVHQCCPAKFPENSFGIFMVSWTNEIQHTWKRSWKEFTTNAQGKSHGQSIGRHKQGSRSALNIAEISIVIVRKGFTLVNVFGHHVPKLHCQLRQHDVVLALNWSGICIHTRLAERNMQNNASEIICRDEGCKALKRALLDVDRHQAPGRGGAFVVRALEQCLDPSCNWGRYRDKAMKNGAQLNEHPAILQFITLCVKRLHSCTGTCLAAPCSAHRGASGMNRFEAACPEYSATYRNVNGHMA